MFGFLPFYWKYTRWSHSARGFVNSAKVNKTSDSIPFFLFFSHSSLISVNKSKVIKENNIFEVYGPFLSVECLLCHFKIRTLENASFNRCVTGPKWFFVIDLAKLSSWSKFIYLTSQNGRNNCVLHGIPP